MFKRCKVVMLPTEKADHACLIKNDDKPDTHGLFWKPLSKNMYFTQNYLRHIPATSYHLYILSDDEIKEGDCFYGVNTNHVYSTDRDAIKNKKKVIATTDSQLAYVSVFGIPSPSQSFIEKYIAEYNKGNVITEVMVEYEEYFDFSIGTRLQVIHDVYGYKNGSFVTVKAVNYRGQPDLIAIEEDNGSQLGFHLSHLDHSIIHKTKVNPKDNTITIRKIKDSWTRDEVIALIHSALTSTGKEIRAEMKNISAGIPYIEFSGVDLDKWIEQNI